MLLQEGSTLASQNYLELRYSSDFLSLGEERVGTFVLYTVFPLTYLICHKNRLPIMFRSTLDVCKRIVVLTLKGNMGRSKEGLKTTDERNREAGHTDSSGSLPAPTGAVLKDKAASLPLKHTETYHTTSHFLSFSPFK